MISQTLSSSSQLPMFLLRPAHTHHQMPIPPPYSYSYSYPSISIPPLSVTAATINRRRRRSRKKKKTSIIAVAVECGLRDKGLSKKPLWRKAQDMSSEAIQASRALTLAISSDPQNAEAKVERVFQTKISRLLKSDLLSLLFHLQRSNSCQLALKVFEYARKESWYKPDIALFYDMIYLLARNELVEEAEHYFLQLKEEGLEPDSRIYTEMIGAYMEVGLIDKAMDMYTAMKGCGCKPNELTFTLLIKNLVRFGRDDLVAAVKEEVEEYLDEWELYLRKLEGTNKKK